LEEISDVNKEENLEQVDTKTLAANLEEKV
jgi:hypothetical protein